MSDEQKIQLLKRQAPLLFPLIEEFKIYNTELKNTLEPLSKLLRDAGKKNPYFSQNLVDFIKLVSDVYKFNPAWSSLRDAMSRP